MPDYCQFEQYFAKKINRLIKSKLPNQKMDSEMIESLNIPNFEDLTAISRSRTIDRSLKSKQFNAVLDLLTKACEDFLTIEIKSDDTSIRLNPMDVIYHALKHALPESRRILINNLDKMKLALPLVIPNNASKPKICMWPFIDISRQTRERSFNLFNNPHHVIAAVRLGNCDGFGIPLSKSVSKSDILNGMFFEGQHRFLSRKHDKMSRVMKKNQLGSIETCIHTPNKKLNKFLQIWNLQGNVLFEGLEAQTKLIKNYASVIIVILDNDQDLERMNSEIINLFGEKQKVIVCLPPLRSDGFSDDDSEDDVYDNQRSMFPQFDVVTSEYLAEMFEKTRLLVSNHCDQASSFTLEQLKKDENIRSSFDMDVQESIVQDPMQKVEHMLSKIDSLHRDCSEMESLQKCFPLYYSRSSIDDTKKVVEHIEFLEQTKVQFFRQHQRGEFEMENKIDEQINALRQQQQRIADQSFIAVQYMNDILDLQKRDSVEIQNEKIRLYHKGLAFNLAKLNKSGIDIVGFQRELGQRFIALTAYDERRDITKTLKRIVEAGVSIELIDGDTQSLNQEIIVSLLESLR